VKGINFTLCIEMQHSSVTGWANLWTPQLAYRFSRHFSADASFAWFTFDKAFVPVTVKGVTNYPLQSAHSVIGDLTVAGTYELAHGDLGYNLRTTIGLPTGNSIYGLSANTTTYNVVNHVEYSFGPFTPDVEIGMGDSSGLVNPDFEKAYTAVGPLANFQAGSWIDLPWTFGLDLEAYEALPLGNQKIYGTVTTKGKGGKTITTTVLESNGVAEDNGFTADLDIPLGANVILSGEYDRSLRQHNDIASFSITYNVRAPKKHAAAK